MEIDVLVTTTRSARVVGWRVTRDRDDPSHPRPPIVELPA